MNEEQKEEVVKLLKRTYNFIDESALRISNVHIIVSREMNNYLPELKNMIEKLEGKSTHKGRI